MKAYNFYHLIQKASDLVIIVVAMKERLLAEDHASNHAAKAP